MKKLPIALLCFLITLIFSCKKDISMLEKTDEPRADYLPGPCPYDCHDSRCTAYLNGYCGPGSTTAPDQLPSAQFISLVGTIHNNALTYGYYNTNLTWTDGYSFANNYMNSLATFYATQEGGMTIPYRTDIVNYAANIFSNYNYFGTPDGHALDSLICLQISRIAPTRNITEKNLLMSALNIYHFNASAMTVNQMFDTIIARANPLMAQYSRISWAPGSGDCIGGYLQIVLNSANYWKYVNTYGVPPQGNGSAASATSALSIQGTQPNLSIKGFFRMLAWPELDAGSYLWGWGKSYFGGEPEENKRIKAGLTAAAEASFGRWASS